MDYTKISLAEAIREIDQVTVQVKRDFGSLTPTQLNWKPAPDKWSIGECLEHLIATNGTYFEVVESILLRRYRKPFLARLPVLPKMYGRWLVGEMSPQSERKVPTMAVFEPARSTVDADEVQRFVDHQSKIVALIRSSERLDIKKTIIASPATSMVVYSLLDAWRLIAAHEVRHLGQARNVAAMDGFGA